MKYRIQEIEPIRSEILSPDPRCLLYRVQQKSGSGRWKTVVFINPETEQLYGGDPAIVLPEYALRGVEGKPNAFRCEFESFTEAKEYVNLLFKQDAKKRYKKPVTIKTY